MAEQIIAVRSTPRLPHIGDQTAPAVIGCVYRLADWFTSAGMDDDRALDFAAEVLHVDLDEITGVLNRLDAVSLQ